MKNGFEIINNLDLRGTPCPTNFVRSKLAWNVQNKNMDVNADVNADANAYVNTNANICKKTLHTHKVFSASNITIYGAIYVRNQFSFVRGVGSRRQLWHHGKGPCSFASFAILLSFPA